MKPKLLFWTDDAREVLVFQQLFSDEQNFDKTSYSGYSPYKFNQLKQEKIDSFELITVGRVEDAEREIVTNLSQETPVSLVYVSINDHQGLEEKLAFTNRLSWLDSRIYSVILYEALDPNVLSELLTTQAPSMVLKKPFCTEEILWLTLHFSQAWIKDASLNRLQNRLMHKASENLFEASIYGLLNPILHSVSDKVNSQIGLLALLNDIVEPNAEYTEQFESIKLRLQEDAINLTKTFRVVNQLFSGSDEVTVFTVGGAKQRVYSLIPELSSLPENIEFQIAFDVEDDLSLSLPVNLLVLAVSSLVRNALDAVNRRLMNQYSAKEKGYVRLVLSQLKDRQLCLQVIDNGEGFDEDELTSPEQLIEAGYSQKAKHSGLGLSIVKQFVEQVQGSFSIESQGIGKGASASIVFPMSIHQNS